MGDIAFTIGQVYVYTLAEIAWRIAERFRLQRRRGFVLLVLLSLVPVGPLILAGSWLADRIRKGHYGH